jgi:hypothetical protein
MCGTPFPHRAMTAPEGQSTLAFGSAPLEAPSSTLQAVDIPQTAEPEVVAAAEIAHASPAPQPAPQTAESEVMPVEAAPAEVAPAVAKNEVIEAEALEVAAAELAGQPVPFLDLAPAEPAHEAAIQESAVAESPKPEEPPVKEHVETAAEFADEPVPVLDVVPTEPSHEVVTQEPAVTEPPQAEEPLVHKHVAAAAPPEREEPRPTPHYEAPAEPRLQPFLVQYHSEPRAPSKPIEIRPTPETLPFELPPASAGMPTFQEVQNAAGAPPISPFEPVVTKPADEDEELKDFVANFKWTPPAETAGELTMRSEVPVVDKEEPAAFHHPSFDDDEPPPETEPHPTGQEYYTGSHEARNRFLEISENQSRNATDEEVLPAFLQEEAAPKSSMWWLWTSIIGLIAVFGGLGFWEGRAQSTHAFRGPVELLRDQYDSFRQRSDNANSAPPASSADTKPSDMPSRSQTKPAELPAQQAKAPEGAGATSAAAVKDESKPEAATAEPKPVQTPPAPKQSSQPQPGRQELERATNASDPTAAAAWLWKATSRGNPEAPVRLADMYIRGNGVPKSCEQALVLLRSAAAKENAPARNRLAALYANGNCVARDRVRAYQLMSSALAADPSSEWAKENRQVLWGQMTPQERSEAQKPQ